VDPITTLYERLPAPPESLPPPLAARYGGGLALPERGPGGRPYVIGNFVETVDGVISFNEPGHASGGDISGFNDPDRFVMGLLRARADAVIFGSGTLHQDPGAVRTAPLIFPDLADEYAALRRQQGQRTPHPLNVVVSASGRVDLNEPTFHQPDLRALIATTAAGQARLAGAALPPTTEVRAIPGDARAEQPDAGVDPAGLLALLGREYGVRLALHEGGPHLIAAFLAAGLLDELFLTLAPQFAGRDGASQRPALLEGHAFAAGAAPWADLLSVKRAGEHLFLRYGFPGARPLAPATGAEPGA
jgi:riboflavin biosynthesis pyrimidine reductase